MEAMSSQFPEALLTAMFSKLVPRNSNCSQWLNFKNLRSGTIEHETQSMG